VPAKNRKDGILVFIDEINKETQSINWVKSEDIIEKITLPKRRHNTGVSKPIVEPIKPIRHDEKRTDCYQLNLKIIACFLS
jgi:hypothetical protein